MPDFAQPIFSIDQNCHPLWDVVPKLDALAAAGHRPRHYVEDIDVAFAAQGAKVDKPDLRLARERYHRSGGADWGAAVFYSEFLGRQPLEIRNWEPYTGLKTSALAKQLDATLDELYDRCSPGDNWQLIGSSYVGDRAHHRVIGDLRVAEAGPFLRQVLDKAEEDLARAFPEGASRGRWKPWLDEQRRQLDELLSTHAGGGLTDLYADWLARQLGDRIERARTSELFAPDSEAAGRALMALFVTDYPRASALYNEAIEESGVELRPLHRKDGELPFFATVEHEGHLVRTAVHLRDGELHLPDRSVPCGADDPLDPAKLSAAGVRCLAGKAVLLVLQVRLQPGGRPLALPYRGSLYMPAAHLLAGKLRESDLLPAPLEPLLRVRFRLLDRMGELDTVIRLPEYLSGGFDAEELPARDFAARWKDVVRESRERLESFRDEGARERWQRERFAEEFERIDALDARKRKLARENPKDPRVREIWKEVKAIRTEVLAATVRQIDRDWQRTHLEYWDSRGALLPWCLALGGEAFYRSVVERAEIYTEEPA